MKNSKIKKGLCLLSATAMLFANTILSTVDAAAVSSATPDTSSIEINDQNVMNAHYSGTDNDAYGYGGIINPETYLKNRYGYGKVQCVKNKRLNVNQQTMSEISRKSECNCSLVAISKVLKFWRDFDEKTNIPFSIYKIYDDVESIAKKHGYDEEDGTDFWKINNICDSIVKKYGYTPSCDGVYNLNWNSIKSYLDKHEGLYDYSEPIILNCVSGYYGNHSVTVMGYSIYILNNKEHHFLRVSDGWSSKNRFIDFDALDSLPIFGGSYGSYNTISMK